LREEQFGSIFLRIFEDIVWGTALADQAFIEEIHPIGYCKDKAHLGGAWCFAVAPQISPM
jgi:hypothetical protein